MLGLGAVVVPSGTFAAGLEPLTIVTRTGRHAFEVELAREAEAQARGLMFRRHLPQDRGMLFDYAGSRPITMYMRNTYLPLDMVFIRGDGTVARIEADTEPLSERLIPSGEPVRAVLELNAGTAARLGLAPGDRVEHPSFRR